MESSREKYISDLKLFQKMLVDLCKKDSEFYEEIHTEHPDSSGKCVWAKGTWFTYTRLYEPIPAIDYFREYTIRELIWSKNLDIPECDREVILDIFYANETYFPNGRDSSFYWGPDLYEGYSDYDKHVMLMSAYDEKGIQMSFNGAENKYYHCQRLIADYIDNNVKEPKNGERSFFFPKEPMMTSSDHMLDFTFDKDTIFYDVDVCLGLTEKGNEMYEEPMHFKKFGHLDIEMDEFIPRVYDPKYKWTKPKHYQRIKKFFNIWMCDKEDEEHYSRFYKRFNIAKKIFEGGTYQGFIAHVYMDDSNSMVWSLYNTFHMSDFELFTQIYNICNNFTVDSDILDYNILDYNILDYNWREVIVVDESDSFIYNMSEALLNMLNFLWVPVKEVYIIKGYGVPFKGDFVARKCDDGECVITMY